MKVQRVTMKLLQLVTLALLGLLLLGCHEATVGYQPPFLPVKLVINQDLKVSISGEASLLTPLGSFSIGASYDLKKRESDALVVRIRDRKRDIDHCFEVNTNDEVRVKSDGMVEFLAHHDEVTIDVTNGEVREILFQPREAIAAQQSWLKPMLFGYEPFQFCKWAYDDSTIEKWYGLGFLWFVARFAFSAVLFVADLVVLVLVGPGALLHGFFGLTVRNIYFGLLFLITILIKSSD